MSRPDPGAPYERSKLAMTNQPRQQSLDRTVSQQRKFQTRGQTAGVKIVSKQRKSKLVRACVGEFVTSNVMALPQHTSR